MPKWVRTDPPPPLEWVRIDPPPFDKVTTAAVPPPFTTPFDWVIMPDPPLEGGLTVNPPLLLLLCKCPLEQTGWNVWKLLSSYWPLTGVPTMAEVAASPHKASRT